MVGDLASHQIEEEKRNKAIALSTSVSMPQTLARHFAQAFDVCQFKKKIQHKQPFDFL